MDQKTILQCNKCKKFSMGISLEKAIEEVTTFNKYYDTLSEKDQESYYGKEKSSVTRYQKCNSCGNDYLNFQQAEENNIPLGITLNPIIDIKQINKTNLKNKIKEL